MRARRSVSNIAWPAADDDAALDLAAELGFTGIELAPAKVFGPLDAAGARDIEAYRRRLAERGLAVPALQAILFGVADAHLFASEAARERLAARLRRVAEVAGLLEARACVFGSPPLRDPGDRSPAEAADAAAAFFADLAPVFAAQGSVLAFEPNPAIYNCRFVTHTREAMALVRRVSAPGFGLQIDMGTVFANEEDAETLRDAARIAAHCHASEPGLAPLGTTGRDHDRTGAILAEAGYEGWISVEMKAADDWRGALRGAADVMRRSY